MLAQGDCSSCRGQSKTKRLLSIQVQAEETLGHFERFLAGTETVSTHQTFGAALDAMRINSQQLASEMSAGAPDLAQSHLQRLALEDCVSLEQLMVKSVGTKGSPLASSKPWLGSDLCVAR